MAFEIGRRLLVEEIQQILDQLGRSNVRVSVDSGELTVRGGGIGLGRSLDLVRRLYAMHARAPEEVERLILGRQRR